MPLAPKCTVFVPSISAFYFLSGLLDFVITISCTIFITNIRQNLFYSLSLGSIPLIVVKTRVEDHNAGLHGLSLCSVSELWTMTLVEDHSMESKDGESIKSVGV